jgi:PAS domain S-box-containing protein
MNNPIEILLVENNPNDRTRECRLMEVMPLKVLLVEDRESDALLILNELKRAGFEPEWHRVENEPDYLAALDTIPELILADYALPQFDALRALELLRQRGLDIPLIIVSGSIGEDIAVQALQDGAADYLLKDRLGRLGQAVNHARSQKKLRDSKRLSDEALQDQLRLAALSADVGLALTARAPLAEILEWCCASFVRNLRAGLARIWVYNELLEVLELQASAEPAQDGRSQIQSIAVCNSLARRVAERRATYVTNDLGKNGSAEEFVGVAGDRLTVFAGYPLLVEDRLVGVAALFAAEPLPPATLETMAAVANHIALGIEQKRSDESLRITDRRLQQLVSTTPAVIFALHVEGEPWQFSWISHSVERLTGYTEAEVLEPRWWHDHIHPEDFARAVDYMPALRKEGFSAVEYRFRGRDGSDRWLLDQKRLLEDATEIVGSWLDITERKQLEEQFRQANKMEAIGCLAGGVAHDFNNLLTVIIGYSELALEFLRDDDPLREYVEQINAAGTRGAALTRQLLAFGRRQLLVPVVVDLNALLAEMERMLQRLIGEDVDLALQSSPRLWPVKVDPGQMEQVVMNLVINSRDAMPRGGKLTIETSNVELDDTYVEMHPQAHSGSHVRMSVSDTGTGMDAATRVRIFEPFFTTKAVNKGTGLGLATVYGIVAQSGGHIEVYSEPGLGTTFKIYIPRDSGTATQETPQKPPENSALGSETVLLVEDSDGVRSLARLALERSGYRVLEAGHPQHAIQILDDYGDAVHVLVTDVVMPGMSGRELAERLSPNWPGMRVLFVSGYTDDAVVRHGILEEGTPFLQKPFTPDSLVQKVREVLDYQFE